MTHHPLAFIPVAIGALTVVAMSLFATYHALKHRHGDRATREH